MLSRLGAAWGTFGAWRRGQPRTTPVSCGTFRLTVHLGERPWAALLQTAYRPWHARGHGLDRPCRARPADRSLVAEDRSAGGVRDRTGPGAPGTRWRTAR